MNKILKELNNLKKNGKKIVLCHGVFDIIHVGHIKHFEEAKKFGDVVVVSVTNDKFVNKGKDRPIFSLKKRINLLKQIRSIDYVIPSNYATAKQNILLIKPNIYFKGPDYKSKKDYTNRLETEISILKKFGGEIKFSSGETFSSTKIINLSQNKFDREQIKFLTEIKKKYDFNYIVQKINKVSEKNFSVIGEIIFDKYNICDPIGISGKDPFLVLKKRISQLYIGGTFSISKNISSFSKKIKLFSFYNKKKRELFLKKNRTKNLYLNLIKSKYLNDIEKVRYVDKVSSNKIIGVYNYSELNENKIFFKNLIDQLKKKLDKNFILSCSG